MRSKNVEPQVSYLLREYPETRDSNKKLLLEYWQLVDGLSLSEEQKKIFMRSTPAESITRARRELREAYPPSKAVEEKLYERFEEEQQDHSRWLNHRALPWLNDNDQ